MLSSEIKHREYGTPRDTSNYRFWKRNNAVKWYGVKPDQSSKKHPPLVKKVSERGETHYVELWDK